VSKSSEAAAVPAEPITLDDLRHKALKIREDVVDEAKATVADRGTQMILIGVVAVVAVISLAYLVGTRAGRRAAEFPLDR
jgi:hypothetical protein